jgi:hypothetical protein
MKAIHLPAADGFERVFPSSSFLYRRLYRLRLRRTVYISGKHPEGKW